MQEDRDSESVASTPVVKTTFIVVGALAGLMLLICGGTAGYVALTGPDPTRITPEESPDVPLDPRDGLRKSYESLAGIETPFTDDPSFVKRIAATIFDIDLLPGFEPIEGTATQTSRRVVYGKKTEPAALLKMAAADWQVVKIKEASLDNPLGRHVLNLAETENGRTETTMKATRDPTPPRRRELTVLGEPTVFAFRQGKRVADNQRVWKIWGSFGTEKSSVALILMIPEAEYDEDAVVRMIESIRAPDLSKRGSSNESPTGAAPSKTEEEKPATQEPEKAGTGDSNKRD